MSTQGSGYKIKPQNRVYKVNLLDWSPMETLKEDLNGDPVYSSEIGSIEIGTYCRPWSTILTYINFPCVDLGLRFYIKKVSQRSLKVHTFEVS